VLSFCRTPWSKWLFSTHFFNITSFNFQFSNRNFRTKICAPIFHTPISTFSFWTDFFRTKSARQYFTPQFRLSVFEQIFFEQNPRANISHPNFDFQFSNRFFSNKIRAPIFHTPFSTFIYCLHTDSLQGRCMALGISNQDPIL
jgi:hypothetical protein